MQPWFDTYDSPFAPKRREPALPSLSPEEEEGVLSHVLKGAVGGLGYVGSVLDKTFGARAGRAALKGLSGGDWKPSELLSFLPGSDTLGLTSEDNRVSGEDLAKQWGAIEGPGERGTFELRDLLGPAIEIGLDPATYMSFGGSALTKAGKVAKKIGVLDQAADGGARAATTLGSLLKTPALRNAADIAAEAGGTPLAHLENMHLGGSMGLGLPFMDPLVTLDLSKPLGVAKGLAGSAFSRMPGSGLASGAFEGTRNVLRGLFDHTAGNTINPVFQKAAGKAMQETEAANALSRLGLAQSAREFKGLHGSDSWDRIIAHNEGVLDKLPANLSHPLTSEELRAADYLKSVGDPMADIEIGLGSGITKRPNYMPGYLETIDRPVEGFGGSKVLSTVHASQKAREPMFENLMAGHYSKKQMTLDDMVRGPNRKLGQPAPMPPGQFGPPRANPLDNLLQESQYVREKYLGMTPQMDTELNNLVNAGVKNLSAAEMAELTALRNVNRMTPAERVAWERANQRTFDPIRLLELEDDFTNAARLEHLQRLTKDSQQLSHWLAGLDSAKIGPEGAFISDPWRAMEQRALLHNRMVANTNALYDVLAPQARPMTQSGDVHLLDLLENLGLTNRQGVTDQLMKRLGITNPADLLALHIPEATARDAGRFMNGFNLPDVIKPVVENFIDPLTQTTKAMQTAPWPGFHFRNWFSSLWQGLTGGAGGLDQAAGRSAAKALLRGEKAVPGMSEIPLFKGLSDAEATQKFSDLAFAHGAYSGFNPASDVLGATGRNYKDFLARVPGEEPFAGYLDTIKSAVPKSKAELNPLNVAGGFPGEAVDKFAPVRAGREIGNYVENTGRLGTFHSLLKQGYTPEVAAQMTKAAHIDYSALSQFERAVMRRAVPFYSFARGSIPEQVRQLVERPGGLTGAAIRTSADMRDQQGFVPPYLGGGIAIPWGEEKEGRQRYLTRLDLPYEQAFEMLRPGPHGISETMMSLLGQTNPLIKAPLELATGKQFFTGRDLEDLYSPLSGLLGRESGNVAEQVLMNSPASRAYTTAKTLVDQRKWERPEALLTNLLTGFKLSDVDVDKQKQIAARELVNDMLRGEPGVRSFETVYIPKDRMAEASPEDVMLARLNKTMEERAKKKRKEEKTQSLRGG